MELLRAAIKQGAVLPAVGIESHQPSSKYLARTVPKPDVRPVILNHPRLRRSSRIGHYAAAAAAEAVSDALIRRGQHYQTLGIVLCTMCGCATYTRKFFGEVLLDPITSSPILFPETVFNAPASHVGVLLQSALINYTLIGDAGVFLHGLATASHWLMNRRVDACVVIGCEEVDWTMVDAVQHFSDSLVLGEGAGAMVLERSRAVGEDIHISTITDPITYRHEKQKSSAIRRIAAQLSRPQGRPLLFPGLTGSPRIDTAEASAWSGVDAELRLTKPVMGEAFSAGAAWQCVAAIDALRQMDSIHALVTVPGLHREAIGACFSRKP